MNFDDTPEEAAFRRLARAWLDENVPTQYRGALERSGFAMLSLEGADVWKTAKEWQKRKYEAGWACLHWPKQYGGRGASPIERVIWQQEEGPYGRLSSVFGLGHGMCGPTLMTHATEEQKQRFLPRIASGEEVWCQLFSEPAAGSDLAGLRTRATRDGDHWVVNGQKIWTSGAQYSDYGLLLARTDQGAQKHRGLTMFFLDMRAPGVEVRPIRQMNEQSSFNEVYFSDVRIPDNQRLGAVNDGWRVSLTTLMNERLSIGAGMPTGFEEIYQFCSRLQLGERLAIDDARVRSRLAQWAARASGLKYTSLRSISQLSKGETPGPENSIGKVVAGSTLQEIARFALDLQGEAGLLMDRSEAPFAARFQVMLMRSPATRIEGGTDEILKNVIAERVLGMPADLRADKGMPFDRIPTTPG